MRNFFPPQLYKPDKFSIGEAPKGRHQKRSNFPQRQHRYGIQKVGRVSNTNASNMWIKYCSEGIEPFPNTVSVSLYSFYPKRKIYFEIVLLLNCIYLHKYNSIGLSSFSKQIRNLRKLIFPLMPVPMYTRHLYCNVS